MKVTRVSKYGFQVDNVEQWHNWDKNITKTELKVGDDIEITSKTDKGYVTGIEIKTPKSQPQQSIQSNTDAKFRDPDQIIREGALKEANLWCIANLEKKPDKTETYVLQLAMEWEKWIRTGEKPSDQL